jgi:DNA-binding beta-propeller fold protein YncE
MILGMTVVLVAPIGTSPAQGAPTPAWTAYVVNPSSVTPINTATNTAGTPIPVTEQGPISAGSIAITPNGATAYVTDPSDNIVTPIDLATNTAETPITIRNPGSIAITPNGATAYVVSPNSVTPIDTATNTAGAPIPVNAQGIAITPNGATAYVTDPYDSVVTPINLATNIPETPITGIDLDYPAAIAITPNGTTALVSSGGATTSVTPINLATKTPGTPITVDGVLGPNIPSAIAITPNGTTAYVTQGSGLFLDGQGDVTPINLATDTAGTPIMLTGSPSNLPGSIAITPDGSTAYVSIYGCMPPPPPSTSNCSVTDSADIVTPINTATNTAETPIAAGAGPNGVAITPDQAPVAHLSVSPALAGQPTSFNASASTVAVGTITTYVWKFGDGSSATTSTPTTTHTYALPGSYTATVTETDSAGTSTTQIFTGQTMSNNGGPSAVAPQNFTVPAISTSILLPSNGATLSGSTYLDASASNATSVKFLLFGGSYGYNAPVLCTATPTIYGWLCAWNATTVPNGAYTLVSVATNSTGVTGTAGVSITVDNPTVSFAGSTVFTYPSESVGVTLSQSSTNTVQVDFTSAGGPGAQLFWGAWTGGASSFSPSSGTVTFAPGQTTATIPLTVNPTTVSGCDSTTPCYPSVTITLTDPINAVLGSTTVTNVFYAPVPGS